MFDSRVAVSAPTGTTAVTTAAAAPSPLSTIIDGAKGNADDNINDDDVDSRNHGIASSESGSSSISCSGSSSAATAAASTMTSGQESAPESEQEPEGPESGLVVGRCLDCDRPFDQFSGTVVCTVGRSIITPCTLCPNAALPYIDFTLPYRPFDRFSGTVVCTVGRSIISLHPILTLPYLNSTLPCPTLTVTDLTP